MTKQCKTRFADRFPDDDEGSMTNTANTLVSNRAHVLYANHLHLTRYIAQNLKYQRPNSRYILPQAGLTSHPNLLTPTDTVLVMSATHGQHCGAFEPQLWWQSTGTAECPVE